MTIRVELERLKQTLTGQLAPERVRADEPLARHTFYRIGGPADLLVTVESAAELAAVVALARQHGVPFFILGNGSNLLVADAGLRGLVVENQARAVQWLEGDDAATVRAESGASLSRLAREAARRGWDGLTWACGIPGTVGGGVVQNAGAHGSSLADVLQSIEVLDTGSHTRLMAVNELELGYRDSRFRKPDAGQWVILTAEMALLRGDAAELTARVAEYDTWRRMHQPAGASCGSVFKNPTGDHAGRLIQAAGLKGRRVGGAEISTLHANFIVNHGGATAAGVLALIELARQAVQEQFGVSLELEMQLVG